MMFGKIQFGIHFGSLQISSALEILFPTFSFRSCLSPSTFRGSTPKGSQLRARGSKPDSNAELKALESFFGIFGFAVIVFIHTKNPFFMNILSGFLSGLVHKTRGETHSFTPKIWGGDTPETEKNSETPV